MTKDDELRERGLLYADALVREEVGVLNAQAIEDLVCELQKSILVHGTAISKSPTMSFFLNEDDLKSAQRLFPQINRSVSQILAEIPRESEADRIAKITKAMCSK